ncbi:MAG: glutathione ABC transporter substrate-binding protein [Dehalococcoidia bacterium]|nr:MAG: glutathione ABC transporter substrate-binding protein [Dehalococcoidia bacterium]
MRWNAIASLALAALVTACAPTAPSNPSAGPAPGGTTTAGEQREEQQILRIGSAGLIASPTPSSTGGNAFMLWTMYDNLVSLGKDYTLRPSIAERWELQPDNTTWRFFIRRDMTWPNGDKLTAADVEFTMNQVIEKNWPQRAPFASITAARLVDEYTVDFIGRQTDQSIPYASQQLWIAPKKYYEQIGDREFVLKPMGLGPYELVEFRATDVLRVRKKRTPHAFRTAIADELIIRQIPENSQVIAGLRTGDLDIASSRNLTAEQADSLKAAGMVVLANPGSNIAGIMLQGRAETENTPLKDRRVRLAINYAIDREGLAKAIYRDYAQPTGQLAFPGTLYHDPSVPPFPYDPAQARRLLAEAGYPNGFKLPYGVDFTLSMTPADLIVAIQSNLRQVGIELEVHQLEATEYVDKAYGRKQQGDMMFGGTADALGFGPSRVFQGCGKPAGGGPGTTWYCNPEWDRLMDLAYAERDLQKRIEYARQANAIQRQDSYLLFLLNAPSFIVHSPKVRGMNIELSFIYNFDSVYKVK